MRDREGGKREREKERERGIETTKEVHQTKDSKRERTTVIAKKATGGDVAAAATLGRR